MRILAAAVFMTTIAVTLAAIASPSAAVVIYPWCADYLGRGGYGAGNCGSVSLKQCLANGGSCNPNPLYQPYPPPPTPSPPIRR
jgi:hypothetical protein